MTEPTPDVATVAAAEFTVLGALPAAQAPDGLLDRLVAAGLRPVRGEWLRAAPEENTDPVGEPDVDVPGLDQTALQILALSLSLSGWPDDTRAVTRPRLARLPFSQTRTRVLLGGALNQLVACGLLTVNGDEIRPGPALAALPLGRSSQLAQVISQLRTRLAADGHLAGTAR